MSWRTTLVATALSAVALHCPLWAQATENAFVSYVRQMSADLNRLDSDSAIRDWILRDDSELRSKRNQIEALVVSQYPSAMRAGKLQEKLATDYEPIVNAKVEEFKKSIASVHCDRSLFTPNSTVASLELGAPSTMENAVAQLEATRLGVRASDVAVVFATIDYPEQSRKFIPSEAYQSQSQRFNSTEALTQLNPRESYWLKRATVRLLVVSRTPATTPEAIFREEAFGIRSGFSLGDCTFVDLAVHGSASPDATFPSPTTPPKYVQQVEAPPIRIDGRQIAPPKQIKDVRPIYPPLAQSARVQGVVIIEATIDAQGIVKDAKITRSIPLLDEAALDAVRQWRYAATVIDGIPVAVIMTVRVQFSLQ